MNKKEVLDALSEEFAKSLKGIDATNGDVIKAVFPNVKIIVSETGEIAHIDGNTLIKDNFMFVQVSTKWLNSSYKAESEEV